MGDGELWTSQGKAWRVLAKQETCQMYVKTDDIPRCIALATWWNATKARKVSAMEKLSMYQPVLITNLEKQFRPTQLASHHLQKECFLRPPAWAPSETRCGADHRQQKHPCRVSHAHSRGLSASSMLPRKE